MVWDIIVHLMYQNFRSMNEIINENFLVNRHSLGDKKFSFLNHFSYDSKIVGNLDYIKKSVIETYISIGFMIIKTIFLYL